MARNDPGGSLRSSGSNGGPDHDAEGRLQENGRRSIESTPQSGRRSVNSPEELAKIRHSRQPAVMNTLCPTDFCKL